MPIMIHCPSQSRAGFGLAVSGLLVLGAVGGGGFELAAQQQDGRPSRPHREIRRGQAVEVDGTIGAAEWADADSVLVRTWSPDPFVVLFKHDGGGLLFAFTSIDPMRPLVPEILIAVDGLEERTWGPDHWWFHASGSDCWASGSYNQWSTCVQETPAWEASNPPEARERGSPLAWEVRIPFSTLGWSPDDGRPLGLAFDFTDTERCWFLWPSGAQLGIPSTWATARLTG